MANFFTSASTNFVLDHQLSPRRLSSSSHHVEFRDMPRRLSAHVEFRDLPCSHIDGHLQPPPHLYHRRRSSDVSHDRRHHHHKEVQVHDFVIIIKKEHVKWSKQKNYESPFVRFEEMVWRNIFFKFCFHFKKYCEAINLFSNYL